MRFGAVKAYEAPFRAGEAGVSCERVIYRWDHFQPRGPSDWQGNQWFSDAALERELAAGRKVVGVVLGSPPWQSGTDPNAAPHNLDLPFDSPDNYWGQFMRRMVAQYRDRVDDWIIWNEPDIWNNDSGIQQWNGSVEQYCQLVKVAYQAARSVNPNSRIILAGLTYWWDQQFVQYFQRAILEWHTENPARYRIQRRLVGNLLYPGYYEPPVDPSDPKRRPQGETTYFPDGPGRGLGHYVANFAPDGSPTHFKEYFDSHGGAEAFGYPKEEPKLRDGRWTQRFQAAVFEYHPENDREGYLTGTQTPARDLRVMLEPLGEKALSELELPLDW